MYCWVTFDFIGLKAHHISAQCSFFYICIYLCIVSGGVPEKASSQKRYKERNEYVQSSLSLIKFFCLFKKWWSCILNAVGEQATPVCSQSAGTAEDGHQLSCEILHPGFDYVGWQSVMRGIFKSMSATLYYFSLKILHPFFLSFKGTILAIWERKQNKTNRIQD